MTVDLGRVGIWQNWRQVNVELAAAVEQLGYGAIWLGSSPPGDLRIVEDLLDATSTVTLATGIVNMWREDAATVAASYHRVSSKHPGRFLLGVGIGHPESTEAYQRPYDKMVSYLDQLDQAGVPVQERVLAALGPRVLRLSGERSAGAHPYLTTPEHTKQAHEILGEGPLLAPEHKVVMETDPALARGIGRPAVQNPYLGLSNYLNNLRRLGYTDADFADGGSDRLIDALVLQGDAVTIARGITAHFNAGADHVAIQALTAEGGDPLPTYRALADALGLG
ncbi:MAG: LLM class F420-dependent oxidoreductase [Candidatus Dormibacteraeota bacterium]|uniref:LLM class F420-dependent oxidoreductase n=1 Tax=Candidatus Dormiibacter inghamiae TaxID=3127013 RepID=A0A934NHM5_9BACT|nr:LLM class F420-dependent oxidoreductase [Candidatus Dormibacteraeota bacterium]MBJ7607265.1 LLM class F420-dependent oxidoreductase [Candidatus Dormibacteraeota bacterium]